MSPNPAEIVTSYRHLHRHLHRAVQYSKPSRYTALARLRHEYRTNPPSNYHPVRIARTLEFLDAAARETGLEHRILKGLLHVWWQQQAFRRGSVKSAEALASREQAFEEFGHAVRMLEETMGIYVGDSVLQPKRFDSEGPFPE